MTLQTQPSLCCRPTTSTGSYRHTQRMDIRNREAMPQHHILNQRAAYNQAQRSASSQGFDANLPSTVHPAHRGLHSAHRVQDRHRQTTGQRRKARQYLFPQHH